MGTSVVDTERGDVEKIENALKASVSAPVDAAVAVE